MHLPHNYDLCTGCLNDLLKRLRHNPEQLAQYNSVIQEQLRQGMVETVKELELANYNGGRLHISLTTLSFDTTNRLPNYIRMVYDASAKTDGP